jgi:hypothetical protein
MKGLFAFAVILLASSAAQAQYTFDYGGRTIRIDPDRGTVSIPGVYDNSGPRSRRSHNDQDIDRPRKQPPQQTKIDPQAPDHRRCADRTGSCAHEPLAGAFNRHSQCRARRYLDVDAASSQCAGAASPAGHYPCRHAGTGACCCSSAGAADTGSDDIGSSISHLAARPLADRRERGQGPDRALRPQSLRVFRRRQVEPEWRAGPDQYEARQGLQMAWTYSRPENRQQL